MKNNIILFYITTIIWRLFAVYYWLLSVLSLCELTTVPDIMVLNNYFSIYVLTIPLQFKTDHMHYDH